MAEREEIIRRAVDVVEDWKVGGRAELRKHDLRMVDRELDTIPEFFRAGNDKAKLFPEREFVSDTIHPQNAGQNTSIDLDLPRVLERVPAIMHDRERITAWVFNQRESRGSGVTVVGDHTQEEARTPSHRYVNAESHRDNAWGNERVGTATERPHDTEVSDGRKVARHGCERI